MWRAKKEATKQQRNKFFYSPQSIFFSLFFFALLRVSEWERRKKWINILFTFLISRWTRFFIFFSLAPRQHISFLDRTFLFFPFVLLLSSSRSKKRVRTLPSVCVCVLWINIWSHGYFVILHLLLSFGFFCYYCEGIFHFGISWKFWRNKKLIREKKDYLKSFKNKTKKAKKKFSLKYLLTSVFDYQFRG